MLSVAYLVVVVVAVAHARSGATPQIGGPDVVNGMPMPPGSYNQAQQQGNAPGGGAAAAFFQAIFGGGGNNQRWQLWWRGWTLPRPAINLWLWQW